MKKVLILTCAFILCLIAVDHAPAGQNIFVDLAVPQLASTDAHTAQSYFIQSVTDTRVFDGPDSGPETPSWGVENPKDRTDELKRKAIGRAVARGGKKEGNVLIGVGDITTTMRDVISGVLVSLGQTVIEDKDEIKPETILVDVEIMTLWGFFREAFVGGSMIADIEAAIILNKQDKIVKKTIKVSSKKSARYPQKPENWEIVFNMALKDYSGIARKELRQ